MSVRLMSAIWDMEFSPVEKLILLAVADWANDEGLAWPSIAQLAKKTGCGERTVQRTLRTAEQSGLLKRYENPGKGCSYRINPSHAGTPATEAPAPETTHTPATLAPNTPVYTIPQKATPSSVRAKTRSTGAACRLAGDWKPTRFTDGTIARQIIDHRGQDWAKRALESFRNHWHAANGPNARKRDWQAAWGNWVIEQDRRDGNNGQPNGIHRPQSATGFGPTIDAVTRFAAREGHH